MKLRLMTCAIVASAALFATNDYTGDGKIYGVLGVSDNTSSNTVVGVPWVSGAGESISLSNLVSTATLDTGDIVYLYEGTTWYGYRLNGSVWEPMKTISGAASVGTPGSADDKPLTRGTGLIIQRASNAEPIYLCGCYDSSSPSATSVGAGATVLIANPLTTTNTIDGVGAVGDQICIPLNGGGLKIYEKTSKGWGTYNETKTTKGGRAKTTRTWESGCSLAPGMGAWYKNKSENATVSIAW